MILNNKKGMSMLSLLITLSVFSGIFLAVNQWASYQRKSAVEIYQRFQAMQISQNQRQRQFLGLSCEPSVRLNQVKFDVRCQHDRVWVKYPRGEISL